MTTITAEIDGQTFAVDLTRVSGLDALTYRHAVGSELDALILGWLEAGRVPAFLADLAVVRWLWERQNVDPLASLAAVAASVALLPPVAPEADDVGEGDAETVEALKQIQVSVSGIDEDPPAGALAPLAPTPAPAAPAAEVAV